MSSSVAIAPSGWLKAFPQPQFWQWQGFNICYQVMGDRGPNVVLVHGFGASWGHWRKVIPLLAQTCRVYAIDLIGFGASDKPTPGVPLSYTFETWGQQLVDFSRDIVGSPVFFIGNSIGCIAAMQATIIAPTQCIGVVLINCSVRMLHERRRAEIPWHQQLSTPLIQSLLGISWFGRLFFSLVARPTMVRRALLQAYAQAEAVTDELVDILMKPASDPGAAAVFAAFTRYSQGPLPEDLLARLPCPALILWGQDDPWEPIEMAKKWATFSQVEKFVVLENAGHCPQDEVPQAIIEQVLTWIATKTDTLVITGDGSGVT
ncbi:MAG: alpha/beta fold hydrolase [Leptolyngbyaceae bacterium]|nr:alpha/beta fold hydrolase [Leptolyngbyaceae bacterium]